MIVHVLMAYNAYLECSAQPKFDDHDPEVFAKQFERFLLSGEEDRVFSYENVVWYHVADYDDESMKMIPVKEPVRLLDCNKVLDRRKIKSKLIEEARNREVKEGEQDVVTN